MFALKVWRPAAVCVLRGNHETTGCASSYGFRAECARKFGGGDKLFRSFMSCFRELPLACVVQSLAPGADAAGKRPAGGERCGKCDGRRKSGRAKAARARSNATVYEWETPCVPGERRALVVHGGLWREHPTRKGSMAIGSLRQLANERRQVDDPENSLAEDCAFCVDSSAPMPECRYALHVRPNTSALFYSLLVLWSDPGVSTESGISANSLRGAGIFYGQGAVDAFLKREHLSLLIRAHEGPDARVQRPTMDSMLEGYSVDQARVVTLFSAANYCGYGNKGCVATFNGLRPSSSELPDFRTVCIHGRKNLCVAANDYNSSFGDYF